MAAGYLTCARGTLMQLLDLRGAHPLWTGPPIVWGTYGRLSEEERRALGSFGSRTAASVDELLELLAAAAEYLPELAAAAGRADHQERLAAAVSRRIDPL